MNIKIENHELAVRQVRGILNARSFKVRMMPRFWCPYDLLVNDKIKIEVKSAQLQRSNGNGSSLWRFNIHRHNKVSAHQIDVYVFCIPPFREAGCRNGIKVVVPAEHIKAKTIAISYRSLISVWSSFVDNWTPLGKGKTT